MSVAGRVAFLVIFLGTMNTANASDSWERIARYFQVPEQYAGNTGAYRSPLLFNDGTPVKSLADWPRRRKEILDYWHGQMGQWPAIIEKPKIEYVEKTTRDGLTQHTIKIEVAPGQMTHGILLVPPGDGPFPAVFVPFYEPETNVGLKPDQMSRAFGYLLSKRGFVTLSIGTPAGTARKPGLGGIKLQPLSYYAYVSANCYHVLASLPYVDPKRIGIAGHSYGSKWAMFASCLYDKFAAAAWSDGGIVWDESRPNVNYWEPWYLGLDPSITRQPGVITPDSPRTGVYKTLVETGHDLHELHALMPPRPFLVSGGSEDPPERWISLNHAVAVNKLLGFENRVGMTNRPEHGPTEESNEALVAFFEHFLKP